MSINTINKSCPCGSCKCYQDCCQPLHRHKQFAISPEQLMRSRYSAFVLHEFDYLLDTHHPAFRGDLTAKLLIQSAPDQWLSLQVLDSSNSQTKGTVHFCAWFKHSGEVDAIHECSNFVFEKEQWFYTDGKMLATKLPGRNDPCICGSGKKFKQCCLKH